MFSSLTIFKISDSFSLASALPLFQSTICKGQYFDLQEYQGQLSWKRWSSGLRWTYDWSLEVLGALLELLQSILLSAGAGNDGTNVAGADIFQDGSQLVACGSRLGNVEVKLGSLRVALSSVIAGLVFRGGLGRIGGDLLQQSHDSCRGRGACLVEDSDDVLWLVLHGFVR